MKAVCKYCKPIFEVETGCYEISVAAKNKAIKLGSSTINLVLALETGNLGENRERKINLIAALKCEDDITGMLEPASARHEIKYCPFCGCKLEIDTP